MILLVFASFAIIIPQSFGECMSLPCDDANIKLGEPNYRFIDFSYANTFEDSITFILERIGYGDCTPFNAEITDEDGNPIWGEGSFALCDPITNLSLVTSQIKIGYNEDNPITISESGTYFIKVQIDDGSIQREFVVRQNHGGASLDPAPYPMLWNITSPIKQLELGIPFNEIKCKENLVLLQKYDGSPACVKPNSIPDLIKRSWTTTEVLMNMPLVQLGKECGHYSHNEFLNRMRNHTLDTLCHDFIIKNALEDEEKMLEQGYLFDVKEQVWKKNGFPDTMMSISYHYMVNLELENENTTISKWDFRKEPSYVIIPLGAVIEGNTSLIPKEITVVLGKNNTIIWINDDDTSHTFVSDKGGSESWSTGLVKPGESSSVTFNKTGVFDYYGTPGPWKTGKVIVLEK